MVSFQSPYTYAVFINYLTELSAENVYALNGTIVKIICKAKHAIDYCWFTHPSGRRISISDMSELSDTDEYRYYGTGLKLGDCGLKIMDSDISDSGTWSCHAGNTDKARVESKKEFTVRISGRKFHLEFSLQLEY